ncbi:30S ribosomal protein S18 [Candidatus Karelsulcia muelleri]|uniref:Small ribosomal subunit protein bS18 n=1 Tax=Candidatus Karelsulcia muelleri TaxID=336810 RepID=A0A346E0V2_9FLAO|nr:30S ribosomal protein S18 [Candidatus Karelsulcia muelleri]AXN02607.1 SSU ribosomal protein S18p [Candidatus Karelsulcia muelleri]WDR79147.1 30S ribosomal protein S18 [Candidatus Karelsulcia muelleri]
MINKSEIKFLTPFNIENKKNKKKCSFKKNNINYIDYKNYYLLKNFLNEMGEILPRKITYTTAKQHRRLKIARKRCRHIGLLPFTTDNFQ